jgi:CheY-like chemotaxis protein
LRKYILLAEDNPADVELVRVALSDKDLDCDLHVVSNGEEAVRFIEDLDRDSALNCPQLLLLDLNLPRRDGGEILQCLRASERCGQTAVVIMTSSDSPRDVERAARNAALHYFRKPNSLDQYMKLGDVVKEIIDRTAGAGVA